MPLVKATNNYSYGNNNLDDGIIINNVSPYYIETDKENL